MYIVLETFLLRELYLIKPKATWFYPFTFNFKTAKHVSSKVLCDLIPRLDKFSLVHVTRFGSQLQLQMGCQALPVNKK